MYSYKHNMYIEDTLYGIYLILYQANEKIINKILLNIRTCVKYRFIRIINFDSYTLS